MDGVQGFIVCLWNKEVRGLWGWFGGGGDDKLCFSCDSCSLWRPTPPLPPPLEQEESTPGLPWRRGKQEGQKGGEVKHTEALERTDPSNRP